MATATPQRYSRDDGYGRSSRFYEVDGAKLPSVTTILSAVAKPALVNWAAKNEREMVLKAAADLWDDLPAVSPKMARGAYLSTLERRIGTAKAHTKLLQRASDIGSEVHRRIEWTMRKELQQVVDSEPIVSDKALWAFMAYEDWRKAANLAPLLVEETVYSKRYGYAGTMDWFGEIDHDGSRLRVVGDWKTGKGIYSEALLQNAAYVHALVEMGHADPPVAGCIVRLPKIETDPGFEVRLIPEDAQKRLFKVFLAVLDLWSWLDTQK